MCTGGVTSAADQVGSYWLQSSGIGKGRGRLPNNHCTISPPQHVQLQSFQDLFYKYKRLLLHIQIGLPALPPSHQLVRPSHITYATEINKVQNILSVTKFGYRKDFLSHIILNILGTVGTHNLAHQKTKACIYQMDMMQKTTN
jgi:hypothetical protein